MSLSAAITSTPFTPPALIPPKVRKKPCCYNIKKSISKTQAVVLNPDIPQWLDSLGGLARAVHSLAKLFFQFLNKLSRLLSASQFTKALTMPFDLFNLLTGTANLVTEKGGNARIDNALGIIGDVSQLGDGAATFATALVEVGAVSTTVLGWAGPLSFASSLLSCVFFAINIRGLYCCSRLLRELKRTVEGNNPKLVSEFVKTHSYKLGRQCGVNTDLFLKTINRIKALKVDEKTQEAKYDQAYLALKRRIQKKIASHSLGMTITLTGVIASTIFFMLLFSPLAPVAVIGSAIGSAFLAVLFAVSMSKMAFEVYSNRRFSSQMRKAHQIP